MAGYAELQVTTMDPRSRTLRLSADVGQARTMSSYARRPSRIVPIWLSASRVAW